jgi:Uma2 family endonuclease
MAEPARNRPIVDDVDAFEDPDEWMCTLLRYVEGPDGRMELQETPLTPEDFLDPQVGDTMVQGRLHNTAAVFLYDLLVRWFRHRPDVDVLHDLKHLMAPRRGPAPDVSVLMGLKEIERDITSYDLRTTGIPPSLIIEVVSPSDRRIRKVDEEDKVELYERLGVREYLLLDLPRKRNGWKVVWRGYRLDGSGCYAPIEPDDRGRLRSETAGLFFGADPAGKWIELVDAETGVRLLSSVEEEEGRLRAEEALRRETARQRREVKARRAAEQACKAAEQRAAQEAEARKSAEAEIGRLREELKRIRED